MAAAPVAPAVRESDPEEAWVAHDVAATKVVEYLAHGELAAQTLIRLCREANQTYVTWRNAVNHAHNRVGRPPYCGALKDHLNASDIELCKFPPDELRKLFQFHTGTPHLFPDMFGAARDETPVQIAGAETTVFDSTFWGKILLPQFETLSPVQIRALEHMPQAQPVDVWVLLCQTYAPRFYSWDAVEKLGEALGMTQVPGP
jgi:hypothetical protein